MPRTRSYPKVTKDEVSQPRIKHIMSDALKDAINKLSASLLRKQLEILCDEVPLVIKKLEDRLLVLGEDVVPYHADSASEEGTDDEKNTGEDSESGEEDSDASDDSSSKPPLKKRKPIAIGAKEYTARIVACENCEEHFDVTWNERGDCIWHSGIKSVDFESDFWADHDENCHGRYEDFADDSEYEEGFVWECCQNSGEHQGCRSTKHKDKSNLVVSVPPAIQATSGRKRKR